MIIFYILTTLSFDNVWTLLGENCCWSLLGLKGLMTRATWVGKKWWTNLFVAPMIKTFFLTFMPSISVSTWLITRSAAPPKYSRQFNNVIYLEHVGKLTFAFYKILWKRTNLHLPHFLLWPWQWSLTHQRTTHKGQHFEPDKITNTENFAQLVI